MKNCNLSAPGRPRCRLARLAPLVLLASLPTGHALGQGIETYGTIGDFAVLAGATITNTGTTTIRGSIGLSPGSAITGVGPGANQFIQTGGTIEIANGVAGTAKSDLGDAFTDMMGATPATPVSGDLGGLTLTAGVYAFASTAQLTGALTLTGDADDVFIIQVGSSLTTASNASIVMGGSAQARNVFFIVAQDVTLGTQTAFQGHILAGNSIALNNRATISCGGAYAQVGAVTLDTNYIGTCSFVVEAGDLAALLGDLATYNASSVAAAIDAYILGGGVLPPWLESLATLSPEDLAAALGQIAGETGAAVAPTGMRAMNSFLDLLGSTGGDMGFITGRGLGSPTEGGTISVMGYAPIKPPDRDGAFASFDAGPDVSADDTWRLWAAGFGGRSFIEGDPEAGSSDLSASDFGLAIGFERQVTTDTMFGFAISGGGTNFDLTESLGSGESAMLQAALYARSEFDDAYLRGALAVGYHQYSTDRYVAYGGGNHYSADFAATNVAGELEIGYRVGWITPYAALRAQQFSTPAYSEATQTGSISDFALDYDARDTLSLRTEIGARAEWSFELDEGGAVSFHASAAWAHEYMTDNTVSASLQALGPPSFEVQGASASADSVIAAIGGAFETAEGLTLSGAVSGKLSANSFEYGGSAKLGYRF